MKESFKSTKVIGSILFLCFCLTVQGQKMLGYEPYNYNKQQQSSYTVRLTGYQYSVIYETFTKIPIKIQVIEDQHNDYYKFIAYKSNYYGWSDGFGTPTINNVSRHDAFYDYFDYYITTPIGKIYFNIEQ